MQSEIERLQVIWMSIESAMMVYVKKNDHMDATLGDGCSNQKVIVES